eukprot:170284_1
MSSSLVFEFVASSLIVSFVTFKGVIQSVSRFDEGKGGTLWDNYSLTEMDDVLQHALSEAKESFTCDTLKDKSGAKKQTPYHYNKKRTSGIQIAACSCGVILTAYENYRAETLCQMWGNCCALMLRYPDVDWKKFIIGFDDVCHFDSYSKNGKRKDAIPGVTDVLAKMDKIIDIHHISNHQSKKKNSRACGMKYSHKKLPRMVKVNTEIAEQIFSWFSGYRNVVISMNGQRFKAFSLCLLHFHNMMKSKELGVKGF